MALKIFSQTTEGLSHSALLLKGTLAEVTAHVAAMSAIERIDAIGMFAEVTDQTGQEFWDITSTSIVPRVTVGKMSSFSLKAKNVTSTVADTDVMQFDTAGVLDSTLTTGANGERIVTTKIAATAADVAKVVKINANGDSVLALESVFDVEHSATVLMANNDGVVSAQVKPNTLKGVKIGVDGVEAKLSTDADQSAVFGEDGGILVKGLKVGSASGDLLSITGNVIDMTKLALAGEWYESTETSIAAYIASPQFATDQPQLDDKIKIVNAIGKIEVWTAKVKNPTTAADFVQTTGVDTTDAIIRSAITAEKGWAFNQASGKGSARLRAVDLTHANDILLDGDDMYVDILGKISDIGFGDQGLQKNMTDLYTKSYLAYNREYKNGLSKTTDANGLQTVVLGGDLIAPTSINVLGESLDFTATTGAINFTTNNVHFNEFFTLVAASGQTIEVYANSLNALKTRVAIPN